MVTFESWELDRYVGSFFKTWPDDRETAKCECLSSVNGLMRIWRVIAIVAGRSGFGNIVSRSRGIDGYIFLLTGKFEVPGWSSALSSGINNFPVPLGDLSFDIPGKP